MAKRGSKNKIDILICVPIYWTTLHFREKCMKKCVCYNPGQVIFNNAT